MQIGEPPRPRIQAILDSNPRPTTDLVKETYLSKSQISQLQNEDSITSTSQAIERKIWDNDG